MPSVLSQTRSCAVTHRREAIPAARERELRWTALPWCCEECPRPLFCVLGGLERAPAADRPQRQALCTTLPHIPTAGNMVCRWTVLPPYLMLHSPSLLTWRNQKKEMEQFALGSQTHTQLKAKSGLEYQAVWLLPVPVDGSKIPAFPLP